MRSRKALRGHSGQAFTLIELLVVIAIIALLVSILLPSLQQAKNLAKAMLCKTQIKGIGTGLLMYAEDCGGWVPGTWPYGSVPDSGGTGITWPSWYALIIALSQEAWERDPDYHPSGKAWAPPVNYVDDYKMFYCPKDDKVPAPEGMCRNGSYGINKQMTGDDHSVGPSNKGRFYNIHLTKRPDQMYLLFCNLNDGGGSWPTQNHAVVKNHENFLANAVRAWTPALRHGAGLDTTHLLNHSGAVSEIHWRDIRTFEGSALEAGGKWRIKGPWLNGLNLTERHDIPDYEYDTIMALPGN